MEEKNKSNRWGTSAVERAKLTRDEAQARVEQNVYSWHVYVHSSVCTQSQAINSLTSPSKTMTAWAFLNVRPTKAYSPAGVMNGNDGLNLLFCFTIQSWSQSRSCVATAITNKSTAAFYDSSLINEVWKASPAFNGARSSAKCQRLIETGQSRWFTLSAKFFIAKRLQRAANDCKHSAEKDWGPVSLSCTP